MDGSAFHLPWLAPFEKPRADQSVALSVTNAVVVVEISLALRDAMVRKVFWRGAEDQALSPKILVAKIRRPGVGATNTNNDINPLVHWIDEAISEGDVWLQHRVQANEIHDQWQHM
jgi:hypothetical protein